MSEIKQYKNYLCRRYSFGVSHNPSKYYYNFTPFIDENNEIIPIMYYPDKFMIWTKNAVFVYYTKTKSLEIKYIL